MKRFLSHLLFLLSIHVIGLVVSFLFRLLLFMAGHSLLAPESAGRVMLQSQAFLRGLWFDNVIGCYILALPLLLMVITDVAGMNDRFLLRFSLRWMQCLWGVSFVVAAADIPYFLYFFKNINSSIWNWAEYGFTTLGMVLGEPSYYPPVLAFAVLLAFFLWLSNRCFSLIGPAPVAATLLRRMQILAAGLGCLALCLFGIRGRTGYNPIKVSAAYYCQDPFLNQLGISPAFNLLTSTLDDLRPENSQLDLMNPEEALGKVQQALHRKGTDEAPLQFELQPGDTILGKRNVVLVFMESMSANLMQSFGQEKCMTPFLDSLFHESHAFTRCYSAGIHTNHGLYATLYSFPALMYRNLMKGSHIPDYSGLPTALHEAGYRNLFFMTHESQYDNMNAFLRTNGYDEIYSQEDYPKDKVVNSFGVQDDYLYTYALKVLDRFNTVSDQPFFATLLSISNHPPFIVPPHIRYRNKEDEARIVEYADHSLKMFFEEARRKPWFSNTVFVLLGDHGKLVGAVESVNPESYNHIPLIIHVPGARPQIHDSWALQMDVQPTILSLLGLRCRQNHFGIDLFHSQRPYAFYTADNVLCIRNADHLYIYEPATRQEHMYLNGRPAKTSDSTFVDMRVYLFSMIQSADMMRQRGQTQVRE